MNDGLNNYTRPRRSKLREEIDTWSTFANSLRQRDRGVFKDMIAKVWEYEEAIENSERESTTEALLMSLILSQQKTIRWLSNQRLNRNQAEQEDYEAEREKEESQ